MANPITDAGHELDSPDWEWYDLAQRTSVSAHDGLWSGRAKHDAGTGQQSVFGQHLTIPEGQQRRLSLWIRKHASVGTETFFRLQVVLFNGHIDVEGGLGTFSWAGAWTGNQTPTTWEWYEGGLFWPQSLDLTLRVVTNYTGGPTFDNLTWYFDDWTLLKPGEAEDMAKRRTIRAAVVTATEGITVANGHPTEVASVTTERRRPDKVEGWPEVQWIYGDEVRRLNEAHRKKGMLLLHGVIYARGDDSKSAEEQCDDVSTSIEQVLEAQTNAQYLGLGYVDQVMVEGVAPFPIDPTEHADVRMYVVDVRVTYRYDRLTP